MAVTRQVSRRLFHELYEAEIMSLQLLDRPSGCDMPITWSRLPSGSRDQLHGLRVPRPNATHHCRSCATLSSPCKMAILEKGLSAGGA